MIGVRRILFLFGLGASISLVSESALPQDEESSGYDRFWSNIHLYPGNEDRFFQSIDLSGRLQLDLADQDRVHRVRDDLASAY